MRRGWTSAALLLALAGAASAQQLGVQLLPGNSPLNGGRGARVLSVKAGTPAEQVGILPGDVIMSIDNGGGLVLTTTPQTVGGQIQSATGPITLEIHTPAGPWQVTAEVGVAAFSAAPGKVGASAKAAAPGGGAALKSLKAKQTRPGGGNPAATKKASPSVIPRPGGN